MQPLPVTTKTFKSMTTRIKLMALFAMVAIGTTTGVQALSSKCEDSQSALMIANIEALSNNEQGKECRWKRVTDDFGCTYHVCVKGGDGDLCNCGDQK